MPKIIRFHETGGADVVVPQNLIRRIYDNLRAYMRIRSDRCGRSWHGFENGE